MKCVVRLKNPVTFKELKDDRKTRELGVVKKRFEGMTDITEDWPLLCEKIISMNRKAKAPLKTWLEE